MYFDADTHISSEQGGIHSSAETLIREMDAEQIDKALIWLHPAQRECEYCDYDLQNEYIFTKAAKYSNRLYPVGWLNPKGLSDSEAEKKLRSLKERFNCRCIKFNGAQNFYNITEPRMLETIIPMAITLGMRLAFHCGNDENTCPEKVSLIAARFPNVQILLVHMGQTECDAAISAAKANANITLIGSGMCDYTYVLKAVREIGANRVCFGSDYPFGSIRNSLLHYNNILSCITTDIKEQITYKNIERFLVETC